MEVLQLPLILSFGGDKTKMLPPNKSLERPSLACMPKGCILMPAAQRRALA
jgi:hypothetical protein